MVNRNALTVNLNNVLGFLRKNGREIPFRTFATLHDTQALRNRKEILDRNNMHIRMRNEVRDRKDELQKKALELFEKPTFVNYVVTDLCNMIKDGYQYDGLDYFVQENIVEPLAENKTIRWLYYCQTLSGYLIPVFQNAKFVDPQRKYPVTKIQKYEPK